MKTHDPRQVIEDLRGHLAAPDRHLTFLFGAGTSSAVNVSPKPKPGEKPTHVPLIPAIEALTVACEKAVTNLGKSEAASWGQLVGQCKKEKRPANVENILSKVRMKIDAIGDGETLMGLSRDQLQAVEKTICVTIAKEVSPEESAIPTSIPHDDFAAWVRRLNRSVPLDVFTTNYDLLFERAFEGARVPIFDGFVGTYRPFFYSECLDDVDLLPGANWVRLWKLHGSINWCLEEILGSKRLVRTQATRSGELILPSHRKYDESRKQPYVGYMDRLSRILHDEHALLIVCGYGFRDEHINAILYSALDNRNTTNIIALQYDELAADDPLTLDALRRPNLTLLGPQNAVISGVLGTWQLNDPVDNRTASFMDVGFDSNAAPDSAGAVVSADLKGRMRLVDFNWFSRFLREMSANQ